MATKKKRGLSGTPAEHSEYAARARSSRDSEIERARKHIKQGKCNIAFDSVIGAAVSAGLVQANQMGAREYDDLYSENLKKLRDEFDAACVVRAGLSGMKRRGRK